MPLIAEEEDLAEGLGAGPVRVRQGAEAAEHLDLEVVQRIHVRVPELDRPLDDRVSGHQRRNAR